MHCVDCHIMLDLLRDIGPDHVQKCEGIFWMHVTSKVLLYV